MSGVGDVVDVDAAGVMGDDVYRVLLDLLMASDGCGVDVGVLVAWADREALRRGYDGWVMAYHEAKDDGGSAADNLPVNLLRLSVHYLNVWCARTGVMVRASTVGHLAALANNPGAELVGRGTGRTTARALYWLAAGAGDVDLPYMGDEEGTPVYRAELAAVEGAAALIRGVLSDILVV